MPQRYIICPWCHSEMQTRDRQGIEIDLCPNCDGIWLDRGELDRIVERSSGAAFQADRDPIGGRDTPDSGSLRSNLFEWF